MANAIVTGDAGVITTSQLDGYLGKSIGTLCQNGAASHGDNSAHFVSHVLGYSFGVTCQMVGSGRGPAATLRVEEVFSRCKAVGVWRLRPASLQPCLVFVTRASNVNLAGKTMSSAVRKRVGIYASGFIWHYSDKRQAVIKETPSQFVRYFASPDTSMFYGSLS